MLRPLTILVAAVFAQSVSAQVPKIGPIPEARESGIGYPNVEAALSALKMKPGVVVSERNGWTIVEDRGNVGGPTLWSFSPSSYPAYPAVVKRTAIPNGTRSTLQMNILCQGAKEPCDALVKEFEKLNDKIQRDLNARGSQ